MSKSLKNFITIKEALEYHSARQIRLAFLLHSWKDTLDYSPETLDNALHYERIVREFKLNVKDLLRNSAVPSQKLIEKMSPDAKELHKMFQEKKAGVYEALCDNIDTRSALDHLQDLIRLSNKYILKNKGKRVDQHLLGNILFYVLKILKIFGADFEDEKLKGENNDADFEKQIMPILKVFADFRENVRTEARELKAVKILEYSDNVRDNDLPKYGVRLEDREGQKPLIKYVDPAVLAKEKEQQKKLIEIRKHEKEIQLEKRKKEMEAKERLKTIPPRDFFKSQMNDKYSKFDDQGLPTHDFEGKELSESQLKKVKKLYSAQEKKYNSYLQTQQGIIQAS